MKVSFEVFEKVLNRDPGVEAVPMYEHGIDYPVIAEIMGYNDSLNLEDESDYYKFWKRIINFYDEMGYPCVSIELSPNFPVSDKLVGKSDTDTVARGYVNENEGVIKSIEDVRNPELWKNFDEVFDYGRFEKILSFVPDHMKVVGGCSGGPFEHATFLMGLVPFCLNAYEDPDLILEFMETISVRLNAIADRLCKLEKLGVYRFGDDMGYKTTTMISPEMLRKYVFPFQKMIVETVHKNGKKFLLHSCGQLKDVMDDLIDDVKIDAKHSFEDVIMPVTEAKRLWGDRVAIMGGIDVDFLCRASEKEIEERTIDTLKICSRGGGYAVGSGNTITSYMPPKNYLAMVRAVKKFNGID